ncbi:NAD(P)-binding protein [Stipitochalara longipes BDJ]|nr:NAD(P)-binding protein [Stipitochalara longipes BDJ]
MQKSQLILVTGANRGIGFSIVQATALRNPSSTYILACRSSPSGEAAVIELKKLGVTAPLDVVELDVTKDSSIMSAKEYIEKKYGRLDVLVNNAGIAIRPKSQDLSDLRESFNSTFDANITSVAAVTSTFLPLLHLSLDPKVVNISSGRASLSRSAVGNMPPTAVVAYSISKAALNSLTIEMQKAEDVLEDGDRKGEGWGKVEFWAANPGHCKTAFNGYRGTKDPIDGAEVVVQLVMGKRGQWKKGGFWEFEEGVMREVPW